MGLFSWNCKKCEHSIKSPYNLPTGWGYMNECVLLENDGTIIIGDYDGYGRIEGEHGVYEINWGDSEPELWHKKCWDNEDSPAFSGESEYSSDQGFFYDDPTDAELLEAIDATK